MGLRSKFKELEGNLYKRVRDLEDKVRALENSNKIYEWKEKNPAKFKIGDVTNKGTVINVELSQNINFMSNYYYWIYKVFDLKKLMEFSLVGKDLELLPEATKVDLDIPTKEQTGFMHIGDLMREIFPTDESEVKQDKDIVLDALKGARALFQAQGINKDSDIGGEQYTNIVNAIEKMEIKK